MKRSALSNQLALFGATAQPRYRDPEPWPLYLAVLVLRRKGHCVYRQGRRMHVVDGERVRSAKALKRLAQKVNGGEHAAVEQ